LFVAFQNRKLFSFFSFSFPLSSSLFSLWAQISWSPAVPLYLFPRNRSPTLVRPALLLAWAGAWSLLLPPRLFDPARLRPLRPQPEASPHQRWLNVTQIPVPGGWQHIYYNRWISLLHHSDTEGTEVPTLQGTTQTLTTTLQ
jgi:hypothetical protein